MTKGLSVNFRRKPCVIPAAESCRKGFAGLLPQNGFRAVVCGGRDGRLRRRAGRDRACPKLESLRAEQRKRREFLPRPYRAWLLRRSRGWRGVRAGRIDRKSKRLNSSH